MLSPANTSLVILLLGACCVACVLTVALYPLLFKGSVLDRRVALVSTGASVAASDGEGSSERSRKRSVEETLREAEEKLRGQARKNSKPLLAARLRQADLRWSRRIYLAICAATGGVVFFLLEFLTGLGPVVCLLFALAAGLLLPHLYVGFRRNRRFKRFTKVFPNAVDVIVRGVKSGLPLVDCLKIIAAESAEPVRGEFKILVEDQTLGMPLEDAVKRLPERIPLTEASFFAIVIGIQSRTGGSLSEALGNLARVLRERQKMQAKIRSMSSEAKASGMIIGSLPVIVGGLVYLTSPTYISLLFTELTGNIVLVACALWMLTGILVMKKMISFKF